MDNIDKKFKELKADKQVNLTDQVMKNLEDKKVKMHSKFYFKSQRSLLSFSFILLLIIIAFLINLTLYDIKESYSMEYLDFGAQGVGIFLQNLPFILIIGLLILFAVTIWLMTRFEISYKKSFAIFVIVLIAGTSMGGTAIFASDFNETVQKKVDREEMKVPIISPVAKKLYQTFGPRMVKKNGLVGQVTQLPDNSEIIVKTPQGKIIRVKLMKNCKMVPAGRPLSSGDMIVLMGQPIVDFHAIGIKIIENNQKAFEMMEKLKERQLQMNFRQRKPLDNFENFPRSPEMEKEFLENMGGYLQSGQDIREANIIWAQ